MANHILSKSTFMYGCQCPKRLYLHKYRPELKNPVDERQQSVFDAGTDIGKIAQQIFTGGVDASPPDPYSYEISVAKTQSFIEQGEKVIYEAAFQFEGVLCAIDILVKQGDKWYAYEVKSTTSVKEQHIQDAALQYWVLTHCGLQVANMSIVHLNNQYERMGDIDVRNLFILNSVLHEVIEEQPFINEKVKELKALVAHQEEPVIEIGPHCHDPYTCDFTDHCYVHMPTSNSIFDLPASVAWKLYDQGIKHLDDIPEAFPIKGKAAQQLEHYRSGEVHIDKAAIRQFLAPLTYPLYFFDFETINPGIPQFDDSRPYQQIPFQYSLHIQHEPNGKLTHHAYLGDGVSDPRNDLMKSIIQHLGTSGSIVCYNMGFEKSRIKELINIFPDFENKLLAINNRVVDLMTPFQRRWYYHPLFQGGFSIKKVLPALVPSMRYDQLDIKEGSTASLVYGQLKLQDAATAEAQRKQLLAYCEMDTLAMVKIYECLSSLMAD